MVTGSLIATLTRAVLVAAGGGCLALTCCTVRAVEFTSSDVGEPGSGALVELFRPAGDGPFPAVVVLHPCNGVAPSTRRWAERLRDWGFVAAVVDSFRPRRVSNVCDDGRTVSEIARASDAFAAAALVATRSDIRADRIGIFGLSHGAGGVIAAATEGAGSPAFRAAVAFYPRCPWRTVGLQTETLILIGEADDWTPAARCKAFVDHEVAAGQLISLRSYPGALHAFDGDASATTYYGHCIGSDPNAAADAIARTREFLASRLR